jgi:hypothetical protein
MAIYIYGLLCPLANTVRYVGKSSNPEKRLNGHLCGARRRHYDHHTARWLRKLQADGLRPSVVILHEVASDERWQDVERQFISSAAERGWLLTNSTAGGEGLDYLDPEDDRRYREKLSRSQKAVWSTPERRAEARARSLAVAADPELLARRNEAIRKAFSDPGVRARAAEINREINSRPETNAKRGAKSKAMWADPKIRQKLMAAYAAPETKTKQSERKKASWADPVTGAKLRAVHSSDEVRRKKSESARRRSSPEYRAMMAERTRAAWAQRKAAKE